MVKEFGSEKNKKPRTNNQKKAQNKKTISKIKNSDTSNYINSTLKLEIICIMVICISLLLIIGVFFNGGGILGKLIGSFLKGIFGIGAYILPLISICFCVFIFFSVEKKINIFKFILSIIAFTIIITFFHIITKDNNEIFPNYGQYLINEYKTAGAFDGGILGAILGDALLNIMGTVYSYIVLVIIFLATIILLTGKSFFISIKNFIKKISNYFYYEYSVEEDYQDEEEILNDEIVKKSIFHILKEIILAKINKNNIEDFNEEDLTPRDNLEYDFKNTRVLKKQKDFIYDGNDRYIKIDKPTFLNMKSEASNNSGESLVIALDEINKAKEQKNTTNSRREIPEFLNPELVKNKRKPFFIEKPEVQYENDKSVFNIQNYKKEHNETLPQPSLLQFEQGEQYEQKLSEQVSQNIDEYAENPFNNPETRDRIRNRVLKREDFSYMETVYSIDFDIPSRKEIEELFSIPPEEALSEDTNFEELDKLDRFYNFESSVSAQDNEDYKLDYELMEQFPKNIIDKDDFTKQEPKQEPLKMTEDINPTEVYNKMYSDLKDDEYIEISQNNYNLKNSEIQSIDLKDDLKEGAQNKNIEQNHYQKNEPIIIKAEKEKILSESIIKEQKEYQFPKLSFLAQNTNFDDKENDIELRENSNILVKTLKSFNVTAQVINISKGPSVTRYELSIEDGIKVSKILGLSDNLALSLAASSIRIEAPIPGKSAVGIEIPNKEVTSVYLSEVICSEKFQKFNSKVAFGIGKDITGNVIVTDIAKMPHMLIAGATGSGKSVCINTLITSILYKASPEEVKLMMIDPKVVELSVYNGIPHLLTPVVTEPEKAAGVLNWAVSEMMERYNLFAQTGTRNLVGYNQLKEEAGENKLPQIVIIIDELADLMMVAAKEVEASICRLAQLARAAGIHLIIATQRPSVDVITGLIKANVPSRIAFAVSSGTDSRTVIDSVGAEKLLGKGDMLFKSVDMNKPLRIQGAFISDKEVETIVSFIKQNSEANYDENIINKIETSVKSNNSELSGDSDELTEDVIAFLVRKGKASTSMIQRQFRIGYNRAARIIEELEDRGIISAENGSKQRDVLMDKYQYEEYINRY